MKNRRWLNLMLFGLLLFLPSICRAQWYQGPSGGYGGTPFDQWKEGSTNISSLTLWVDNSVIRCILVHYRDSVTGRNNRQVISGPSCERNPGSIPFNAGFELDRDEYIIGIAGRYGARIDSIRFYTSKKNSAVFGGGGGAVEFGYTAPAGQKIVAFFGRASDNLDAIGVMYAPIR